MKAREELVKSQIMVQRVDIDVLGNCGTVDLSGEANCQLF